MSQDIRVSQESKRSWREFLVLILCCYCCCPTKKSERSSSESQQIPVLPPVEETVIDPTIIGSALGAWRKSQPDQSETKDGLVFHMEDEQEVYDEPTDKNLVFPS